MFIQTFALTSFLEPLVAVWLVLVLAAIGAVLLSR